MPRRFVETHLIALVIVFVLLSGTVALAAIYSRGYNAGEPIRSDGVGYYIYLPAVFLDHDLSLVRTVDRSFDGDLRKAGDLHRVKHGYLGPHQIGEAILLAPFFAIGHVIAIASNAPRDGFSRPYQGAAAAAGLLYGVVGLALLGAFLRRWFDRWIVGATLLALTFGTNLFHYLTYDAVYSHSFSFAATAFILWSTIRLTERATAETGVAARAGYRIGGDHPADQPRGRAVPAARGRPDANRCARPGDGIDHPAAPARRGSGRLHRRRCYRSFSTGTTSPGTSS